MDNMPGRCALGDGDGHAETFSVLDHRPLRHGACSVSLTPVFISPIRTVRVFLCAHTDREFVLYNGPTEFEIDNGQWHIWWSVLCYVCMDLLRYFLFVLKTDTVEKSNLRCLFKW